MSEPLPPPAGEYVKGFDLSGRDGLETALGAGPVLWHYCLACEYRQRLNLSGRDCLESALVVAQVRWLTKMYLLWSRVIDIGPLEKT